MQYIAVGTLEGFLVECFKELISDQHREGMINAVSMCYYIMTDDNTNFIVVLCRLEEH